jgi:hypothetical protein
VADELRCAIRNGTLSSHALEVATLGVVQRFASFLSAIDIVFYFIFLLSMLIVAFSICCGPHSPLTKFSITEK